MNKKSKKIGIFFLLISILVWPFSVSAYSGTVKTNFPRLANYYLNWDISSSAVSELAKWDVLVLDMEVQHNSLANLKKIRELNPNIIILAYITSEEIKTDQNSSYGQLRDNLYSRIDQSWWLKDKSGNYTSFWTGTRMLNMTDGAGLSSSGERWNDVLPEFVYQKVISTGLWDGVFYDNIWPNISWFNSGNLDADNDGKADSKTTLDQAWLAGYKKMLAKTRSLFGDKYLIVANSRHCQDYQSYENGIMLESFPSSWEADGTWAGSMKSYTDTNNFTEPKVGIINSNNDNNLNSGNYHKMRFTLGSALLGNSSYSFDYGVDNHGQTWWYDEYSVLLGKAVSSPINILDKSNATFKAGLWRRDFENGVVIVNSTDKTQNYELTNEVLTKISGSQDTTVNNGAKINLASIAAKDAVVLLGDLSSRNIPTATVSTKTSSNSTSSNSSTGKTTENIITKAVFKNGAFFRVFNESGNQTRSGFFAYDSRYPSGSQVIFSDIDNDGTKENIVNSNGIITIYRGTKVLTSFKPFDGLFKGDISLAIADLNGNGQKQLVIGAGKGGGPQVRIFNTNGRLLSGGFFAYDRNFRGGVNVAAADINSDGKDEIITGAGVGGGPHVRIFNQDGKVLGSFFAYDKNSRAGVSVATGNLDGAGAKEIITGAGPGAAPQVRVWNNAYKLVSQFLAYDKTATTGIIVSASDVNSDGKDEILAGSTSY
jgi:hypothetical protein